MKIKNKLKFIGTRVTEEQYKKVVRDAQDKGVRISEHVRERLK